MPDFQGTPDPRSLVADGKAGTGSAYILQNAYKAGLDLQRHYDDQDAANLRNQAKLAQQAKLATEKQAGQQLNEFLKDFDPSRAAAQDQQRFAQMWQDTVITPTADAYRNGRNPMLPQNAAIAGEVRGRKAKIMALVNASAQRNSELGANLRTISSDSEGLYGSKADYMNRVNEWNALSVEERATTPPPSLEEVVNENKVGANIVSRIRLSKRTDAQRNGLQITETTDEGITPQNRLAAVDELLAMPGIKKKFQGEYEALAGGKRPASLDEYLHTRAETIVRNYEVSNHDENISFQQARPEPAGNARYERESSQQNQSATNLLTKYNQLRTGGAEQYGQPTIIGGKSYLRSDEFNNYTVGAFNGKPNQVRGVYRDEAGKMYLATDATAGQPVEMRDEDAFNKFLLPAWTGGNMKGKAEVLQAAAKQFFVPGTNTLNTRSLGSAGTAQGEAEARDVLGRNQRYVNSFAEQMGETARGIDPTSTTMITAKSGKQYPKADVDAASLTALFKRGKLVVNGAALQNPKVEVTKAKGDNPRTLTLSYDVTNKKGDVTTKTQEVTPARLAELMKGFVPKEEKLARPDAQRADRAAPGTAPAAGALERATTVTTGTGSSSSSGSSSKGKRDLFGLGAPAETPAPKSGKRNILGL